jgi:hypothetical protein
MEKIQIRQNEEWIDFLEGPSFELSIDLPSCPSTAWEVCRALKFFFTRDFVLDNDPVTSEVLLSLNVVILIVPDVGIVGSPCIPFTSFRWFREDIRFWERLTGTSELRNVGENQFELVKV